MALTSAWPRHRISIGALLVNVCRIGCLISCLSGCVNLGRSSAELESLIPRGESRLNDVPFFPQTAYQCGPAALASVLSTTGISVSPDELQSKVYIPERKGSLQTEMLATVRSYQRLAYVIQPELRDLLLEVREQRPVMVLLNLGVRSWPIWHYAVVIGYDGNTQELILHSGKTARQRMSVKQFYRRWLWADQWGLLALQAHELPATADLNTYMTAAASLEAVGKLAAAHTAYLTAQQHWPTSAWPWLGVANLAYTQQQSNNAEAAYRHALVLEPDNAAARNNLASVLQERGCIMAARHEFEHALRAARGTALEKQIAESLAQLPANQVDNAQCR
jgi:tetratricopeptide (TPR) repeat protein